MHTDDKDSERGLYEKFIVRRSDRSDRPGYKHEKCTYFVLDVNHDPYAVAALKAYIKKCEKKYPKLAEDLRQLELRATVSWLNTTEVGTPEREEMIKVLQPADELRT